jgi:hypothetical protein
MIDNEALNATRAASPRARQRRADGCVQVHDMEAKCLELAARATEPLWRNQLLKMARLLQTDAELLAKSRACIVDSERLLASINDDSQSLENVLASRQARVTESQRLLATPRSSYRRYRPSRSMMLACYRSAIQRHFRFLLFARDYVSDGRSMPRAATCLAAERQRQSGRRE